MTISPYILSGMDKKILAFVLAGGEGAGLRPLTMTHAKPALPVGGAYRLVDFALSNLVNSGIDSIYVLAQYKPQSLVEHVKTNWTLAGADRDRFVSVILPRHEHGGYFGGTADAMFQNICLIERHAPDLVIVFSADHVCRMDVRQMVQYHCERNADVTVAATQVPVGQASSFGVIAAGHSGEVWDFQDRPETPFALPFNPACASVAMGNYLFDAGVLVDALECVALRGETDLGGHLLPRLVHSHHVYAYDFSDNMVPGVRECEDPSYWRDIATLEDYLAVHQDIAGNEPLFNLHNPYWPLLPAAARQTCAPAERSAAQTPAADDMQEAFGSASLAHYAATQIGHA